MDENMNGNQERVTDQAKAWLQENLRVIVSIFIVAAIALGIYSYSQRTDEAMTDTDNPTVTSDDTLNPDTTPGTVTPRNGTPSAPTTPTELSRETETSFVESAARGDGTTHLARRALMNYLEKTPDSSLSGEHKVYIEDYLRKHISQRGPLALGQSAEFSKDLIRQAIDSSKQLNATQLQNLKKYSSRVAAYRS